MTKKDTSEYLVISRGQWDKDASPEKIQGTIDQFYDWLTRLVDEGKNAVTDGPFGEAKEIVGGYWFIIAGSLEEAAQIASGNPCLNLGLFCEIRPIDPEIATAFIVTNETPLERR